MEQQFAAFERTTLSRITDILTTLHSEQPKVAMFLGKRIAAMSYCFPVWSIATNGEGYKPMLRSEIKRGPSWEEYSRRSSGVATR